MYILGIETSCDETSAAVVENGVGIHSNIVVSSLKEHANYGGIIPEIASRRQIEAIYPIVQEALVKSNKTLKQISAIAVTTKPGLIGSLLVGIAFAKALAFATKKPLIEVNHIQAHWYANFLRPAGQKNDLPRIPAVALVVSGGHTSLFHIKDFDKVRLLGQTRDDAAGEAFDKVARLLQLGYPGGPIIDNLAKQGKNDQIIFSKAKLDNPYDFSFSGLKTAVLYYTQKNKHVDIPKLCYSFQQTVVEDISDKAIKACLNLKAKTLLLGGGVAANSGLRNFLIGTGQKKGIKVYFPPMPLCLDNAAMIAGLGYRLRKD